MKALLRSLNLKAQFHGSVAGLLINPFYFARKGLYENIKALSGNVQGTRAGCGLRSKALPSPVHLRRISGSRAGYAFKPA